MIRIYTEDVNETGIHVLLNEHGIDGYTVYHTTGAWRGTLEKSIVLEFFDLPLGKAKGIAASIAKLNSQETVAVAYIDSTIRFVAGRQLEGWSIPDRRDSDPQGTVKRIHAERVA